MSMRMVTQHLFNFKNEYLLDQILSRRDVLDNSAQSLLAKHPNLTQDKIVCDECFLGFALARTSDNAKRMPFVSDETVLFDRITFMMGDQPVAITFNLIIQ